MEVFLLDVVGWEFLAQTLLNLAYARFEGQFFSSYLYDFEKKQDQKQLGIRFAHKAFLLATLDLGAIFSI